MSVESIPISGELIRFKATNITGGADVLDLEIPTVPFTGTAQFIEANTEGTTAFRVDHTGDIYTKGELHGENSGDADMKALAYGYVDSSFTGNFYDVLSSDGFTVTNPATGVFYISITGNTDNDMIPIVTVRYHAPRIATIDYDSTNVPDGFMVRVFDLSGNLSDTPFTFVVYKKWLL